MAGEARMGGMPEGVPGRMQDVGRVVLGLGMGERLAVLGAVGVLAVSLVFGLITRDYGVGQVAFLLAVVLLFVMYRGRVQQAADGVDYTTLVIALGGMLGLIGLRELVLDLRFEIFDAGTATILAAMLFWASTIAAGAGALQVAMARR
ncbi:MAG: hypothetical protein M0R75_04640 [Dehalococcoidia bacterium]|nr:hypothetical protein [Dehalococcoidia bacterium]